MCEFVDVVIYDLKKISYIQNESENESSFMTDVLLINV